MSAQNAFTGPQGNATTSHLECPSAPRKPRSGPLRRNRPLIPMSPYFAALGALDAADLPVSRPSQSSAAPAVKKSSGVHKATAKKPKPQPKPPRSSASASESLVGTASETPTQNAETPSKLAKETEAEKGGEEE